MNLLKISRTALFIFLMAAIAAADKTPPTYQKGTITKKYSGPQEPYDLQGADGLYFINNCGDFQIGQSVDYRTEYMKIYIRQEGGKEHKCRIGLVSPVSADKTLSTYQQGTIMGYETRLDTWGVNSKSDYRRAKVYELKGTGMLYKIDYCGAFQAGDFAAGQSVDYRVNVSDKDDKRLFIRRDNGKEYSCQLEGTRIPDGALAAAPAPAATPAAPAPPAPAASPAKP